MDPHLVLGGFGFATALLLFLAPIRTIWRIKREESTQQVSGFPYVATLLNCLVSAWYGLPFVSKGNIVLLIINGIGVLLEATYVVTFASYAATNVIRKKILWLLAVVLAIFGFVVLVSVVAFHGNDRKVFCGLVAALCSIVMYASPLSEAWTVITTESVERMELPLSLCMLLCGAFWLAYGIVGHDPFVAVPSGIGLLLGALQLILYFIFRPNQGVGDDKKTPINSYEKPSRKSPPTENLFPPMDPKGSNKRR